MGEADIAIGNAVGSVIANIGLIVGLVMALTEVRLQAKDFRRRAIWYAAAMLILIGFSYQGFVGKVQSFVLILFAFAYVGAQYCAALQDRPKPGTVAAEEESPVHDKVWSRKRSFLIFLAGLGMVLIGSRLMVDSGIAVAEALRIPSLVIGLTIIAIGTSLPELVTGLTSVRKGYPDLSIGNIIGANILDLTLIVGVSGVINPLVVSRDTVQYSYPYMVIISIFFLGTFLRKGISRRWNGWVLLAIYGLYITGLVNFALHSSLNQST
ncbi:MAG: hypothetical protein A2Z83_01735 [Omnitrophica bacterium GWA2_52_8]|nr:MAG: hypothetical protein A2Z83_01735 [Omnitrophica bacterium GWA2_52_8]